MGELSFEQFDHHIDQSVLVDELLYDADQEDFFEQKWEEWSLSNPPLCDVITNRLHQLSRLDPTQRRTMFEILILSHVADERGIRGEAVSNQLENLYLEEYVPDSAA